MLSSEVNKKRENKIISKKLRQLFWGNCYNYNLKTYLPQRKSRCFGVHCKKRSRCNIFLVLFCPCSLMVNKNPVQSIGFIIKSANTEFISNSAVCFDNSSETVSVFSLERQQQGHVPYFIQH